ncbi:MAG: mandelate racemase/muconate lactonizing enzyme family protein [Proteobacteria bacterium]|nr:mandelate racemase/muconate lactonizing enzyme family protein [Pseudomonadota bacterium]MCP4917155.1 mandelate racemase/muconate lactonizing enzyme family protein [Pseudomonadota bacterium]
MSGMRIARIELFHVAVPLAGPFHPSWIPGFRQVENRFDLLRIETADGVVGWSAAPSMGGEREGWGQFLGSYFLGERADDLANVRQRIREMGYLGHRGGGFIEPACWDIVGKARNKPVYELLGGTGGRVKLYASTGEMRTGAERVIEVQERRDEGFQAVKLRVHAETLEEDIEQIRMTREAHPDVVLGVDCNQAWRVAAIADCAKWDYDRALAFCKAAEELDFAWVEEPLPQDDYEAIARLNAATGVTLAGGELNTGGLPEFRHMVARGCYDWYQPDAIMVGGVSETWAIVNLLKKSGAAYSPHTWTNGIGFAINLQIFAATKGREEKFLEYPLDPPGWVPEGRDGLLMDPFHHDKGFLDIPTKPGLGFEIDESQLRRHGRRWYVANKVRVAISTVFDRGLGEAKKLGAVRDARLDAREAELNAQGGDPFLDPVADLLT